MKELEEFLELPKEQEEEYLDIKKKQNNEMLERLKYKVNGRFYERPESINTPELLKWWLYVIDDEQKVDELMAFLDDSKYLDFYEWKAHGLHEFQKSIELSKAIYANPAFTYENSLRLLRESFEKHKRNRNEN